MIPKYRAWDKRLKVMCEVGKIDFINKILFYSYWLDGSAISFDEVELMQSTGLKDRNGVEIYECDIIDKRYHNMHTYDSIGVVEFGKGYDSDGWAHGEWFGWVTDQDTSLADVHEECTVLGNKYENPELLEDN